MICSSDLTFVESPNGYHLPDGRRVPSVTEILRATGVSEDFSHVKPEDLEFRRILGTAVHWACHAFDDDDLDFESLDPRVQPYVLDAWSAWRINFGAMPVQRERRVYHPVRFYAGTLDGIFELRTGTRVLVDIKCGDPWDAAAQFQTAAYEAAYRLEHPDERIIDERLAVQLCPELTVPYRVTAYRDWTDFRKFEAFCVTYWEQAARRRRA